MLARGDCTRLKHEAWADRGSLQHWLETRKSHYSLLHASGVTYLQTDVAKELAERDITAQHDGVIVTFGNLKWLNKKIS